MSRWTDIYNEANISENLRKAYDSIKNTKPSDETNLDEVQELSRAKKALRFINETIDAIDPELFPLDIINNLSSTSSSILHNIDNYNNGGGISPLQRLNSEIDRIIAQARPFYPISPNKAKAAGRAFSDYSKEIEAAIKRIKDILSEIYSYYKDIFNEDTGIKSDIDRWYSQIDSIYEKIESINEDLFSEDEEGRSKVDTIKNAHDNIVEIEEKVLSIQKKLEKDSRKTKEKLKSIFGYTYSEETEDGKLVERREEGDIDRFYNLLDKLEDFEASQKKKYESLVSSIESLIPGAVNASLASAFREKSDRLGNLAILYSVMFSAVIFILALISSAFFIDYKELINNGVFILYTFENNRYEDIIYRFVTRMALASPFIWLAMVFSKRRNQYERLKQEYMHKEVLGSSYKGFRKQIDDLGEGNDILLNEYIRSMIAQISSNPSTTLDGKHSDNPPIASSLEKILSKSLSKITEVALKTK